MYYTLTIDDIEIKYFLRKHKRAKKVRIIINDYGEITVTTPSRASRKIAESFLIQKKDWLLKNLEKKEMKAKSKEQDRQDYLSNKEHAREFIKERLFFFNSFYKYTYNSVRIKNQKSVWGSCSKKGNLNFNYKLIYLPRKLADYIIVHELCHLEELNHSEKFWNLVSKTITDVKKSKRQLRNYEKELL